MILALIMIVVDTAALIQRLIGRPFILSFGVLVNKVFRKILIGSCIFVFLALLLRRLNYFNCLGGHSLESTLLPKMRLAAAQYFISGRNSILFRVVTSI